MRRDLANIEAGYYRMPHDMIEPPRKVLRDAVRFIRDLPEVQRRRQGGINAEVFEEKRREGTGLPRYYLQNFHYQTDGYLSDHSAELYDYQVEVLFGGGADAMRRQALVPLHHHFHTRRTAEARLLDVASGTGRFLTFVKDNYPRLDVTALDLEPQLSRPSPAIAGALVACPCGTGGSRKHSGARWQLRCRNLYLPVPRVAPEDPGSGRSGNGAGAEG